MAHAHSPAAEELLDIPVKVLDKGFLILIDYMGNDERIASAARTSFQGDGRERSEEENNKLVRRLMKDRHTSPFEMVEFLFHAKMPIFVARQWVRHRTASINEVSARYSVIEDDFYIPENDVVQAQSKTNKQGRDGELSDADRAWFIACVEGASEGSYARYELALQKGVSRELARMLLPVNIYTRWYWKCNLHNLLHFLSLRCDPHAQYEIRVYADAMLEMARAVSPATVAAWEEFVFKKEAA